MKETKAVFLEIVKLIVFRNCGLKGRVDRGAYI